MSEQFGLIAQLSCYTLAIALLFATYRLTLHPLARYPGPILARLSGWHNWYHASSGDRHLELWRQHQRYGPVVRFAPNAISFNTAEALHEIYEPRRADIVKSDWYRTVDYSNNGNCNTFSAVDRERHAAKRRLLSHAFSDKALKEAEYLIQGCIRQWQDRLRNNAVDGEWSTACDFGTMSNYLTFDVLGELCLGRSFDVTTSPKNRYVIDLIPGATKSAYDLGYHPLTSIMRPLIFKTPLGDLLGGQMVRDNNKFNRFCDNALEERQTLEQQSELLQDGEVRKDFFHYLFRGKDPETGQGYAKGELGAETKLLVIAGSDTSSTTLAACFFYLIRNEDTLKKLTSEIRSNFSSVEEIQFSNTKLSGLPYLRACIDETMRMSPPVPGHLPREVLKGGVEINGIHVPPGTIVGVSPYCLHHNENYFPNSFEFSPERWLESPQKNYSSDSTKAEKSAFCPFSLGSRGCIGKNLAYVELSLAIATTLWLYDIRGKDHDTVGEGTPGGVWGRHRNGEYQMNDGFVVTREGPMVEFKRRLAA